MRSKTSFITRKLLNLYRQHHVIYGGWATINPIFLAEADDNVLIELKLLPTGNRLIKHIENLRTGKTDINSIDPKLLPYGRLMNDSSEYFALTDDELHELKTALSKFTPDENGLNVFRDLSVVKKFGSDWAVRIRATLSNDKDALQHLDIVHKTSRAYHLWKSARDILSEPISNRTLALLQAELPEFETYLPMFGDSGKEVLEKLRTFIKNA